MPRTQQQADRHSTLSPFHPLLPAGGETLTWNHLSGESLALALACASRAADRLLAVITPDTQVAELLNEQLAFFLATLPTGWNSYTLKGHPLNPGFLLSLNAHE